MRRFSNHDNIQAGCLSNEQLVERDCAGWRENARAAVGVRGWPTDRLRPSLLL